jgi:hypothetical protein
MTLAYHGPQYIVHVDSVACTTFRSLVTLSPRQIEKVRKDYALRFEVPADTVFIIRQRPARAAV